VLTRDDGAAVVEFVLVGVLVVTLFLGVLQVGLTLHLRNVVVASLAEGAREAANADRDCADGVARARDLVARAVGQRTADGLVTDCGTTTRDGVVLVRLRARGPLPLLFPPVGAVSFDATAHAIEEGQ
jgi:Flp pilus assembly protein TadG